MISIYTYIFVLLNKYALSYIVITGNTIKSDTIFKVLFENWRREYNKNYDTDLEYRYRFSVFSENYANIQSKNSLGRSVVLGLNKFADLTNNEFRSRHVNHNDISKQNHIYNIPNSKKMNLRGLPPDIDWVQKGAVTPVKSQGYCGSCWAFSTTGSIEGAWFIKTGHLISLSEQQLIDCSSYEGNNACNGGLMNKAFKYIINNDGICSEEEYPYLATVNKCKSCKPVVKITSYVNVEANNTDALMTVVSQQPVSVAVEADGIDWQFYMNGVLTDACGLNIDHGVLVVGYGTDSVYGDYWKVKNSWGSNWGENGYIRLGRGVKYEPAGECGILMIPSYPVV